MILKIFSPKNLAKQLAFLNENTYHCIGFQGKCIFFRLKFATIDPRLGKIGLLKKKFLINYSKTHTGALLK
jgi:hypothetical protein